MNDTATATPVRNFVRKHKVAIAVTATVLVMGGINRLALKQHDEFLKEKNLYDEFYTLEEE